MPYLWGSFTVNQKNSKGFFQETARKVTFKEAESALGL